MPRSLLRKGKGATRGVQRWLILALMQEQPCSRCFSTTTPTRPGSPLTRSTSRSSLGDHRYRRHPASSMGSRCACRIWRSWASMSPDARLTTDYPEASDFTPTTWTNNVLFAACAFTSVLSFTHRQIVLLRVFARVPSLSRPRAVLSFTQRIVTLL